MEAGFENAGAAATERGRLPLIGAAGVLQFWGGGVRLGVRLLGSSPSLGFRRLLLPVSYWRTAEFSYAQQQLSGVNAAHEILDVGSPKEMAYHLARTQGCRVTACDILDAAVEQGREYGSALGRTLILSERQDGRALSYQSDFFDAAISISVLEHIPDDGDCQAIGEMVRVVRPGGLIVVTTPFDREYRETHVARSVYDRERTGQELVFYQRHYDLTTLRARLLEVPGAELVDLQFWGEGTLRIERLLDRIGRFRALLSPLEAGLAWLGLRRLLGPDDGHPMAVFFTLRKVVVPT